MAGIVIPEEVELGIDSFINTYPPFLSRFSVNLKHVVANKGRQTDGFCSKRFISKRRIIILLQRQSVRLQRLLCVSYLALRAVVKHCFKSRILSLLVQGSNRAPCQGGAFLYLGSWYGRRLSRLTGYVKLETKRCPK